MKITKKANGQSVTLFVEGRLDTATAPELDVEINKLGAVTDLTLDFAKLEYVSSAGLRVLLAAQKGINARNGKMVIVKANDVVRDVFDVTGFSDFIKLK